MVENLLYFPKLDLDLDYIKALVIRNQKPGALKSAGHHRLVSDDLYLSSVKEKYPFLTDKYNIYTTYPNGNIPLHVDAKRNCALNIPIKGTEMSETIFYEPIGELEVEYDAKMVFNRIKSPLKEIYRFTLLEPVIINNSGPHEVLNNSSNERLILSWSIDKQYTFHDIVKIIKDYE